MVLASVAGDLAEVRRVLPLSDIGGFETDSWDSLGLGRRLFSSSFGSVWGFRRV